MVFTNKATTMSIIIYSPCYTTLVIGNKKVNDNRSIFKKYYLLFLVAFYLLIFIIPHYVVKMINHFRTKRKHSKNNHCTNINIPMSKKVN